MGTTSARCVSYKASSGSEGRAGFRAAGADETDDAGPHDRRREANGEALGKQAPLVASDVRVVVVKDAGHWILDEKPKETTDALVSFL